MVMTTTKITLNAVHGQRIHGARIQTGLHSGYSRPDRLNYSGEMIKSISDCREVSQLSQYNSTILQLWTTQVVRIIGVDGHYAVSLMSCRRTPLSQHISRIHRHVSLYAWHSY
jgi:hypothetical protein